MLCQAYDMVLCSILEWLNRIDMALKTDDIIPEFLAGGGEMGELIRTHDWSATPLGPIESWPRSLRTCIQIMLTSRQPIWIGWGHELIKLYNDPYKEIVKGKHPWALGKPACEVWRDIWNDIEPMLNKVMRHNEGTYVEEQLLIMERNGYPEETYYTFSYTPVAGDFGGTAGMICFNTDDTDRIISERQLKTLTDLGKVLSDLRTAHNVWTHTIETIRRNPYDFPFAILYNYGHDHITLIKSTEPNSFHDRFAKIDLRSADEIARLFFQASSTKKHQVLTHLATKVGEIPKGSWQLAPDKAIILPIAQGGNKDPYGFLVVGVNPYRLLDEGYVNFFQLVADQIATSLANIYAIEEERKQLEALAEIDRAKTVFFSNISHEFRTPLTLILGSLEELLRKKDREVDGESKVTVETTHRNALRLLRLVNNLLDFSRIDAGRKKAQFQLVDIGQFTRELASNFSSLIENAGLSYTIDIESISDPVYVDKLMWEKIVFNLISNAFKYTLTGGITIALGNYDGNIILSVKDTGVGIPEEELPNMFQRFHRVQNAAGRTYEGTGIGLSLVNELVKLHSGSVGVTSKVGVGTEFTVKIPAGIADIPAHQIVVDQADLASSFSDVFIDEAFSAVQNSLPSNGSESLKASNHEGKVLIVDDNADMRGYIKGLMQTQFHVVTARNGKEALEVIQNDRPDIILSDIMMPVMDGVQLMKAIKANPDLNRLPIILVSARAGEEARIEGYETGADDYLVKPFSAKELLARITSQIKLSKARKEVEDNLRNVILQSPVATTLLRGRSFVIEIVNDMGLEVWGRTLEQVINRPIAEALPEVQAQGFVALLEQVYDTGVPFRGSEVPVQLTRFGKPQTIYLNFIYTPLRNSGNETVGVIGIGVDVSEQVYARKVIEEARASLDNAVELGELGTWEIDLKTNYGTYTARLAEWWGLPEQGATFDDFVRCIHPDDRARVVAEVRHAVDVSGSFATEYKMVNAVTGQERFIQATGNLSYDEKKSPEKLSGIVRDVTMQKLTQQELERQVHLRTTQLERVNNDLKDSNAQLMQFAYGASHDLQEPLRKIQTFSDLAQARLSDPGYVKSYLEKIDSSATRMSALIKDVLLYSQVSNASATAESVDLNTTLQNVKDDFELLIEQKGAVIKSDPLPVVVGNKLQFQQLFSNLIGNSLKFCQETPVIEITHGLQDGSDMDHHLDKARNYHVLSFKDNGVGFEQVYNEQIFGLFNRLHNRKDYSGTGIGLALCKKIVENHNGVIRAFSEKGKGATFVIFLPY